MNVYDHIIEKRWWLFAALLLVMGFLSVGVSKALPPDNALRVWFPADDERFVAYDAYQADFGNDEIIVVHVDAEERVFTNEFLKDLAQLTNDLGEVEHVAHVYSIIDMLHLSEAPGVPTSPDAIALSAAELAAFEASALADPLIRDQVVSADGEQVVVVIEPKAGEDFDELRDGIILSVRDVADAHYAGRLEPSLAGNGVIYQGLNEVTARDFGIFLGAGLLILFIALAWLSRSWSIMFASVGVLVCGTLAAVGAYGWAGHRLNIVTALIPTLVMVLGIADAVHYPVALSRARAQMPDASRNAVAARALALATIPCLLTTLTTVAGFLALTTAPIPAIAHMGLYAAVGVLGCFASCVVLMSLVFVSRAEDGIERTPMVRIERVLARLERALDGHRVPLWIATLAGCALLAVGVTRLDVDTYTLMNLPGSHRVVQDHGDIESQWGPYMRLEFLASSKHDGAKMTDARELEQLERFGDEVTALEDVSSAVHIGTVYHHALIQAVGPERAEAALERAEREGGQATAVVLQKAAIEAGRTHDLAQAAATVLDSDGRRARIMLATTMSSASTLDARLQAIDAIAARTAPDLEIRPVGYPPLYVGIIDQVMGTLSHGFGIAIALIFGVLFVWLRSPRLALVSIVPNLFPLLAMFGVMGWLDIDLDIATGAVAAIVLGVAVDDTIHFLHAWREAESEGLDWHDALHHSLSGAGRAACITSLLLVVGFPVLMLSQVTSVFAFGLLTTVAAVAALIADLVILPLLLRFATKARRSEGDVSHAQ